MSAAETTFTTVRGGLEYGLYTKHDASNVMDFTEFLDCGKHPGAAKYGCAIFAYKSNASVDTRACVFKRNNFVFNVRGGFIAYNPSTPDIFGTGADANNRIWFIKGYGQDDLTNYQSIAGREKSISFGGNTTGSASTVLIHNTNAEITAQYLTGTDQYIELEIFGNVTGAGAIGHIRPSFVGPTSTRYELVDFTTNTTNLPFYIKMIVQPEATPGTVSIFFTGTNVSVAGNSTGHKTGVPVPFNTDSLVFQLWGEVANGGSMALRKTRIILWG